MPELVQVKTKQQVDKHTFNTQGHSQTVSEEAVGLAGSARLAVVERMLPDGTTVVSATTCAKSIYIYIYIYNYIYIYIVYYYVVSTYVHTDKFPHLQYE